VFQVDDLIQPGAKKIAFSFFGRIPSAATRESRPAIRGNLENSNCKLPSHRSQSLQSQNLSRPENRLSLNALAIVHGRRTICDAAIKALLFVRAMRRGRVLFRGTHLKC
jgi:hypothetical protein